MQNKKSLKYNLTVFRTTSEACYRTGNCLYNNEETSL